MKRVLHALLARRSGSAWLVAAVGMLLLVPASAADRPNLIWIMADDLGFGDLGCYGQQVITTPNLDRMAREGLRCTHFYAGATVCAPSRSVLMTGQHHGHTRVRGNAGPANPLAQALRPGDITVAKVLQQAGYRTALIGKWGLGDSGAAESGLPRKHGFDQFFGYLNQRHAHNHFPDFLWRNEERVALPNVVTPVGGDGAGYATKAVQFADDLFADEAVKFVAENKSRPFFLYWSMVIPHANNERSRELKNGAHVPDFGPYADKDWPDPDKGQAAMISRLDGYVGRMLTALHHYGLAENTLVIFTSDNGPHNESNHSLARFNPSGPLSGIKRSLTDGGIRVPMIAWWPGKVRPGTETDHVAYFGDWMATAAELAGAKTPDGCDSISFVPTLLGDPAAQPKHEFLYWEFHEGGFKQAALYQGRWKGIRNGGPDSPVVLYDQQTEIAEKTNVAAQHPDIAAKLDQYLLQARSDNPDWEPKWTAAKKSAGEDPILLKIGAQRSIGCGPTAKRVKRLVIDKPGVYENYLVDGEWGGSTLVKINADNVTLRHCEIRHGKHNAITVYASNVVIESCKIHHVLAGSFGQQHDAHGITGRPTNLTVRNCDIGLTSGDSIQFDPGRGAWDDVLIENCTLWTGPLAMDAGDFKQGERPGENAVDTKQQVTNPRSRLTIRNCLMYGWNQPGQISNMAALNLKNHVQATVENCIFRDNEICFRVRGGEGEYGGAHVTIDNCAVYDSLVAVRAEDNIENLKISRLGIGRGIQRKLQAAGGGIGSGYENLHEYTPPPYETVLEKGLLE